MNALAGAHNAAMQMIETSIVRAHQHGACITRNKRQSMDRSRGGLTSKIHAVVDGDGLPVRLTPTAGEAHDNRLAGSLSSPLKMSPRPQSADLKSSSISFINGLVRPAFRSSAKSSRMRVSQDFPS
jgi:hypothetical protein